MGGRAYLRISTLHALHLLERLVQRRRARLQPREDAVSLRLVELEARLPLLGWVDHHLHQALADDRRAQRDADELVDLLDDLRGEADELEIAAAVPALAHDALADGVQADELDVVIRPRLRLLHVAQHGLEAVELADEDVGLVDLVGEDDEVILGGEGDDRLNVVVGEGGAGGVAGVNDGDGAHVGFFFLGLAQGRLDAADVRGPMVLLVEIVGDAFGVEEGEGGGVERVLWDWNEDSGVGAGADDVEEGVNSGGRSGAEVYGSWVGRMAISF